MSALETKYQTTGEGASQPSVARKREKVEAGAPVASVRNSIEAACREISNSKERLVMNIAKRINNVKEWLSVRVTGQPTSKVLGGLALGALLLTATALPWGAAHADGPARPVSAGPSYLEQRITDTIEDRMEAQRLLAATPNLRVTPASALAERVEERQEVQRLLEDLFNHGPVSAPVSVGVPGDAGSIQERLDAQRVLSMTLGQ